MTWTPWAALTKRQRLRIGIDSRGAEKRLMVETRAVRGIEAFCGRWRRRDKAEPPDTRSHGPWTTGTRMDAVEAWCTDAGKGMLPDAVRLAAATAGW